MFHVDISLMSKKVVSHVPHWISPYHVSGGPTYLVDLMHKLLLFLHRAHHIPSLDRMHYRGNSYAHLYNASNKTLIESYYSKETLSHSYIPR
jgi:hypothetical protein